MVQQLVSSAWVSCAVLVGSSLLAESSSPPLGPVPAVLLEAPVNATWAANHATYWREKGVGGFLFRGLFETLEDTAAAPGLVMEIRLASKRLAEAGLDRNFLHVAIAPEKQWFTDRALFRESAGLFREMGLFCQTAGLRGIALDSRPAAFLYDYRWDGYDGMGPTASRVRQRARDFGRRTLRAFVGACPETEILVIANRLSLVGSLWFDFFEGCVESIGAATDIRVYLLLCADPAETSPDQFEEIVENAGRLLEEHFSQETRALWRRQGSIALGLCPLSWRGGTATANCPPDGLRLQLCAAKALCRDYVWISAPDGGWWRVTPEEARAYAQVKQRAPANVYATAPFPEAFDTYSARTPLDRLLRVGALEPQTYVLRSEAGAAVVFWRGVEEGRKESGRSKPLRVTDLRSGEVSEITPRDGEAVLEPTAEPVLVDGLAIRDWVVPAGLRLWLEDALTPRTRRTKAHIEFANMSDVTIRGTLEAWPPEKYSLGAASFPLRLEPGDVASYERTLQGVFGLGDEPEFRLALLIPGSGATTRRFRFPVLPALDWSAPRDGPLSGPPALLDVDGDGRLEVVVSSRCGDVACYDARGQLRWERRFRGRFDVPPVAGRGEGGRMLAVLADHHGTLRALDAQGDVAGEWELGAPCQPGGMFFSDLRQTGFDVLVAALTDGRIVCMAFHTGAFWEDRTEVPGIYLGHVESCLCEDGVSIDTALSLVSGRTYAALGGAAPSLLCLSPSGRRIWHQPCPAAAACRPRIVHFPGENEACLLLGDEKGAVQYWDAFLGRFSREASTGAGAPILDLAAGDVHEAPGMEVLVVDDSGLYCISASGERLWHTVLAGARHVVLQALSGAPVMLVSTASGSLYALSGAGVVLWQDDRAAGALTGPPVMADLDADRDIECLYASSDRCLRVLKLSPATAPPRFPSDVPVLRVENAQ